jgi:hypothetical protein
MLIIIVTSSVICYLINLIINVPLRGKEIINEGLRTQDPEAIILAK